MRRREAREAVRMARFLNLLHRWESAELNQEEAAELLGVSERTFRRWTRRYEEEGEAGLLDRRLGKASGRRVPADRAEEVERLYRERYQGFTVKHFHEHLIKDHGFGWGYTWLKLHLQWAGVVPKGAAQGRASEEARAAAAAGHDAASGRLAARMARRAEPPLDLIVTMDDATGAIYSAFLVEEEGTASTFRALKEVFSRARPADEPLHRPRGALLSHAEGRRRDRPRPSDPGRPGARATRGRAHRGLFAAGAGPVGAGVRRRCRIGWSRSSALAGITDIEAANAFIREVYLPAHNARFAVPAGRRRLGLHAHSRRRSRRDPVRRGGAPGRPRQLRLLPDAQAADPAKARCGRISSRRGSRSTSIPTAPTPSSTGRAASAATTRRERSEDAKKRRLNPLGGANAVDGMDKPPACPPRPQQNKTRRSGHLMRYQNRTT